MLCKDLSDLTLLLCGKTDELGNVDSEGIYQLKIGSAEAQQCGMRSNCDLETCLVCYSTCFCNKAKKQVILQQYML